MLILLAIILLIIDIPFVILILNIYRKLIKDIQGTTLKPKLLGAIIAYSIIAYICRKFNIDKYILWFGFFIFSNYLYKYEIFK